MYNPIVPQDVYLQVDVKERLPEINGYYISYLAGEWGEHPFAEGKFWLEYDWENEIGKTFDGFHISHWLEKHPGMIVLSVEDYEKIVGDAFEAGEDYYKECVEYWEHGTMITKPDNDTYLKTLFK